MSGTDVLRRRGLLTSWPSVLVAMIAPIEDEFAITPDEAIEIAGEQVGAGVDPSPELVELAGHSDDDAHAVLALVRELAAASAEKPGQAERLWRAAVLEEVIVRLPDDPLYGTLELTEFWRKAGYPPDSPMDLPEPGFDPADYYSDARFAQRKRAHRLWARTQLGGPAS